METTKFNFSCKKFLRGASVVLLLLSFISCSQKATFKTSTVVPAARGKVTVNKDSNKNYEIKIKIEDLSEVSRLKPSRKVYVVWMQKEDSKIKNIGQIKSESSFMSSKLKANFLTVTSFKPSKIFITAEDNANAPTPGKQLVLETGNF